MNAAQRRKQNKLNAQNSTGPRTEEGKSIARMNAKKHGFTAQTLVFPKEDPEMVAAHVEAIQEALNPENYDEDLLVEQATIASLKLKRIARAEEAVIADQVVEAEMKWSTEQETRRMECARQLQVDPAMARLQLQTFGAGVAWLLEQWLFIQAGFQTYGSLNNVPLIHQALRLLGFDPENLKHDRLQGYDFAMKAVHSLSERMHTSELMGWLEAQASPIWLGRFGRAGYSPEEARKGLGEAIDREVARLKQLHEAFMAQEETAKAKVEAKAAIPLDTPQNRLMLRYARAAESSLEKSLKSLAKLKKDREKAEAADASEGDLPNEPELRGYASTKRVHPGTYIKIKGKRYLVLDTSDGNLILAPADEVEPEPETEEELGPCIIV